MKKILIKNIIYPSILLIITFLFFITSFFINENSFTTNGKLYDTSGIYYYLIFVLVNFVYFSGIIFFEINEYNKKLFALFMINFIFVILISLINWFIAFSLFNFKEKSIYNFSGWDKYKIIIEYSFYQILLYILLLFTFLIYTNFIISSSLNKKRELEFINKYIWFFIFKNKAYFNKNNNFIIETKKSIFILNFLNDELIKEIIFEYKIKNYKTNNIDRSEKKVSDFFEEFNNIDIKNETKNDDEIIINDSDLIINLKSNLNEIQSNKDKYIFLIKEQYSHIKIAGNISKNFKILLNNEVIINIKKIEKIKTNFKK